MPLADRDYYREKYRKKRWPKLYWSAGSFLIGVVVGIGISVLVWVMGG
jgi:hypothetical protein